VLGEIAAARRADVESELAGRSLRELEGAAAAAPAPREGIAPLLRPGLHVIAELKRRSPSAGRLAGLEADLPARARAYEAGGAAIVSVLVEPRWFDGRANDIAAVRAASALPVLAKDFVVDPRQIPVLRAAGADLVLLIAELHPLRSLRSLVGLARSMGMEPLVEAYDERHLERALDAGALLVGVNNRDLRTLAVDPERAAGLRRRIPDDRVAVAESGAAEPAALAEWRAVGFDAALVGEALMRAGEEPPAVRARTAAFVAAGRPPSPDEDPAAADRVPFVKICGVTDWAGIVASVHAGADAIGFNLAAGTPRTLGDAQASELVAAARELRGGGTRPLFVGIFVDRPMTEVDAIAARLGLDAVQLSGDEAPDDIGGDGPPVLKVLHVPAASSDAAATASSIAGRARAYLARPRVARLLLDTADPLVRGGTGRRADPAVSRAVAREVSVVLGGGLDASTVAGAIRTVPAIGVDVSSGVEARARGGRTPPRTRQGQPRKDPLRVGLFVKRAKAARLDLPHAAARPTPVHARLLDADERGRWGTECQFGGRYVPETLVAALDELAAAWRALRDDPRYWARLRELGRHYVGRPSPLYRADRLAAELERRAGRTPGRLRLYLKREDLNHTGAHKITNALGQALLTHRLGKSRVIAETGAGQHGVATATACALLGIPCVVYMGAEDIRRQAPNVLRMRVLGAEVRSVTSGGATLKDAINEAMRDWVTNVRTTHYVLGSAVGPHPYPTIVRDLQRVIGDEAAAQLHAVEGRLPDGVVACVGGGSNGIGLFSRFIGETAVRLVAVEAAGEGIETGRHAAALSGGTPGVLHGSRSYLLQDGDGQVIEAVSISAGLDYPGIGPQISALFEAGRMEVLDATDAEALDALRMLTATEGIIPALEPAHAIAALPRLLGAGSGGRNERPAAGHAAPAALPLDALVLLGLSGRGDKDLGALEQEAGRS
jgi:tryptophan synthase beta chain